MDLPRHGTARSRVMKKLLWIVAGLILILAAVVLVAPGFVDLGSFKRTYLPLVEDAIHRKVDVGEVRLRLVPAPSIRLSSLKVSDTPDFPDNTFFAAEQIQLRLKLWPLLRGRFEVTELILDKPVVNLLKQPDGTFNYSDIAAKKTQRASKREARKKSAGKAQEVGVLPLVLPARMRIRDGQFKLETQGQKPVRINGVHLVMEEFSADHPFPYRASFDYPGLKTISLEGTLNYREEQSELQIKDNRLRIRDLVLPMEGTVSQLAAVPRVNLTLASDQVEAKPVFDILSVFGLAPADTEVSGPLDLRLTVNGPSNSLVTQVRGKFRDVKIHGKRALKGRLNGEVFIKLPLGGGNVTQRLQGDGKLVARDGELTNVDLVDKIQRVTGMIGLSKQARHEATTFETLEGEFIIGGGLADFKRLYLVNPQMEVNGHGTMTLDRPVLDMRLDAALSPAASSRSGRGRTAEFLKDSQGRIVVPLKITGRLENPSVNLDRERVIKRGIGEKAEKGLSSFFKNLFRRK
jgi:AsmA protein